MSATSNDDAAPAISPTVDEVQGLFATSAALEDAVGRLRSAGFDHADLSLPQASPTAAQATPDQGAADVVTDDDARQMRTLHGGMAGSAGALAAAGVVVASGGALAPAVLAAAVAGIGAGGLAEVAENTFGAAADHEDQKRAAADGRLVLAVRITAPDSRVRAEQAMRDAGATRVEAITRSTAAIDSAGWTG